MREFHASFKESDLVKSLDIWGQTGMNAENSAFNDSGDAEVIKNFSAVLPGVCITILSDGLVVEAVSSGNLSRFMVSSEQRDTVWVLKFQAHQVLERLQ